VAARSQALRARPPSLAVGATIQVVAERLGHENASMTSDLYDHVATQVRRHALTAEHLGLTMLGENVVRIPAAT